MDPADRPISESRLRCTRCGYNLTGVAIGAACPECGEPVETSLRPFVPPAHPEAAGVPALSYVLPVILSLCCAGPFGIPSIVYTASANAALRAGDMRDFDRAKLLRERWLIIGVVLMLIFSGGRLAYDFAKNL